MTSHCSLSSWVDLWYGNFPVHRCVRSIRLVSSSGSSTYRPPVYRIVFSVGVILMLTDGCFLAGKKHCIKYNTWHKYNVPIWEESFPKSLKNCQTKRKRHHVSNRFFISDEKRHTKFFGLHIDIGFLWFLPCFIVLRFKCVPLSIFENLEKQFYKSSWFLASLGLFKRFIPLNTSNTSQKFPLLLVQAPLALVALWAFSSLSLGWVAFFQEEWCRRKHFLPMEKPIFTVRIISCFRS